MGFICYSHYEKGYKSIYNFFLDSEIPSLPLDENNQILCYQWLFSDFIFFA